MNAISTALILEEPYLRMIFNINLIFIKLIVSYRTFIQRKNFLLNFHYYSVFQRQH